MNEIYVVCTDGHFNVITVFDDKQIARQYCERYNKGKSFSQSKALVLTRVLNNQPTEEEFYETNENSTKQTRILDEGK